LGSLTLKTKRDFGSKERIRGKKTSDKYILGSLTLKTKRDFGNKDLGQIHLCEVSLRRRRETSEGKKNFGEKLLWKTKRDFEDKDFGQIHIRKSHFEDEERLRKQRETSRTKTSDKYIFAKSHFEDEERLRREKNFGEKLLWKTKRDFGNGEKIRGEKYKIQKTNTSL
jgi:hypothetical protein